MSQVCWPNFSRMLTRCVVIGKKRGSEAIAAAGKLVFTDNKRTHTRWNDLNAAADTKSIEQIIRRRQANVSAASESLRIAKQDLAMGKRRFENARKKRDRKGRSVVRLDELRTWVEEHMPSVLATTTENDLLRLRFCAAAMRGAGSRSSSPNRFLIPAMWVTVNVNTGEVLEIRSDDTEVGATHPHAREDTGSPCTGAAINKPKKQPASPDAIKKVLVEVEAWRQCYGDDYFVTPRAVAGKVWVAVHDNLVTLAPVQSTSGMVYKDVHTLLQAEPWNRSSRGWCSRCDVPIGACSCCGVCGDQAGNCTCANCACCGGAQNECRCCVWCEDSEATWRYRGSANEHQLCGDCGYCRICGSADCELDNGSDGGWGSVLRLPLATDLIRIQTLAALEDNRGAERPLDYSPACGCDDCRAHTRWRERQRR